MRSNWVEEPGCGYHIILNREKEYYFDFQIELILISIVQLEEQGPWLPSASCCHWKQDPGALSKVLGTRSTYLFEDLNFSKRKECAFLKHLGEILARQLHTISTGLLPKDATDGHGW